LFSYYNNISADGQHVNELLKRIFIIDSTTTSLFKAIMKCVGLKPLEGKRKGGIKGHPMLNPYETVPKLIHFTEAAKHDHAFLSQIDQEKKSFSILISFARQHLFSYKRVYDLTEKAEKDWHYKMTEKSIGLPELFDG
jgi:hypothetical protein